MSDWGLNLITNAFEAYQSLQPALHPVYARVLCTELQARGFDREVILQGTRLNWQTLHESNQFLNIDQMRRLIKRALQLTECPWLGLDVGFRTQASAHGMLGAAMIASKNLPQAMLLLQRFAGLRQNLADLVIESEPALHVVLNEKVPLDEMREYLYGQLLGGLAQLLTALTGLELPPRLRIEWPFAEPVWAEQYARIAAHNSFGHTRLAVHLGLDLLLSPSIGADEDALQRLVRDCELQLSRLQHGASLADRIRLRLQSNQGRMPTLIEMAQIENLTERTLIRHLKAQGHSYKELVDTVRMERACWLLEQTKMTVEQVSDALGYEDPSNFSRTFKRWMGLIPSHYRQQHHGGEEGSKGVG